MIPLDVLAHRERVLQAQRGESLAHQFSLVEALDSSEQALRRVAAAGWMRALERLPRLADK
ncbi:hypothetical protein [Lentzea sp. HUAS12]|uniref:hypothetical protein n=1 Tax=Lentzea sp. HUAS12 TaxID=2951806 RepID=UPI0020A1E0C0|nr:hypothetical protein [Lentzea sp. HUAS12]USX51956.1 hypothetical protein ND450_42640 [Lentzea sp. HUAS12]